MSSILFEVNDLHVKFAGESRGVLRGVSFKINCGELAAIAGESGAGKTVLCRTLIGLPPKNAVVCGETPKNISFSMVLQDPMTSLDPAMRVGRQITEAIPKGEKNKKAAAIALLRLVGLAEPEKIYEDFPAHLSGGMRQRAAIAAALAMRPDVIVADEPTSMLDAELAQEIMGVFRKILQSRKMAVLFVTHDLPLAKKNADRILYLCGGKISEGLADMRGKDPQECTREGAAANLRQADMISGSFFLETDSTAENIFNDKKFPVISVNGLCKNYKAAGRVKNVLRNMTFEIARGETLGVCGPSGAGKSTLLRLLGRIEKPDAGALEYCGRLLAASEIQIIFQDGRSALSPRMRVGEILAEGLLLKNKKRPETKKITLLMERVGLPPHYIDRYPHELSGGERKRVAIARAVSVSPKMILADEPTSMLDAAARDMILALLSKLKREENLTLVLVSHDLPLLEKVCDRVMRLEAGGGGFSILRLPYL